MKKISYRKCIITKQSAFKKDLLRFVVIDNELILDLKQNKPGRGYYMINNIELLKAHKTKQKLIHLFKPKNIDEFINSLE